MKDSKGVTKFSSSIAKIVNQIRSCGDSILEKMIVEKVLRSLPKKFGHIVAAIDVTPY